MFLDPDDKDLKLGEFDFSKKGEVITRNVEIFTGDRGRVNYRYLVERSFGQEEFFTLSTSFRDLAYNRAFFAINPSIFGLIRRGEWYERTVILPVGRPVEAVTSFKTFFRLDNNLRELVDSLIIRDTFLLQTAADTLQQRDYTY
jgi:hypothetical protein